MLAVGTLAQASYAAVFLGTAVLAPELRRRYGLGLAEVGVVLGVVNGGPLLTLLPFGLLTDRVGERAVLAGGLVGATGGLVAAALVSSLWPRVALLTLAGGLGASVNAASGRAVMSWFEQSERGFALGIRQTALPLGGAVSAAALPTVAAASGLRGAFLALAAGCGLGALVGALLLRDRPRPSRSEGDGHALAYSPAWRLSGASALLACAQIALTGFAVLFLHGARGFSTGAAGAVLAITNVLGAAARVAAGRWSDRLGLRILPLRRLGVALAGAVALCAGLVDAPAAVLALVLIVSGTLSLSWNGLAFTATAEGAGLARSGAALGLQQTALALGAVLVPILFAALVEATSWRLGFAVTAAAPLAATFVLRRVREPAMGPPAAIESPGCQPP